MVKDIVLNVQAAAEIAVGTGGVNGGTLLNLTRAESVVDVPAQIAGAGIITNGAVTDTNTINYAMPTFCLSC